MLIGAFEVGVPILALLLAIVNIDKRHAGFDEPPGQKEILAAHLPGVGHFRAIAAAATDVTMRAEILTYSRSRGLFAGVSLEGSTLRPDNPANKKLYKKDLHARDIVLHRVIRPPASARQLLSVLNTKSPRNRSQRG